MNRQTKAQIGSGQPHAFDSLTSQTNTFAYSPPPSVEAYMANAHAGPSSGSDLPEQRIPPVMTAQTASASMHASTPESPPNSMEQMDPSQSAQTAKIGTGTGQPLHGASQDSFAGHFTAHGGPEDIHSDGNAHGNGIPSEDGPVSPLHATLIVMILLAGLAIGIGRSWWIDKKLEAATAKSSVAAALPPHAALSGPSSSIQSSIDRAYIPPLFNLENEEQTQDAPARPSIAPGPATEAKSPSNASPPLLESGPTPGREQKTATEEPPEKRSDALIKEAEASPSEPPPAARQEKKSKSAKASPASKVASADKKDRLKEIERVRTQAFSETSKDRIGERKSRASDSPIGPQSAKRNSFRTNKVAQHVVTRSQYARCERISHIIRREKCKWDLCNDRWGKGACPSFKHEKPFLF